MLIKRLFLQNFRVYEDPLDLELPPGLVGVFGPNGSGKSTLLEAILWTLWGKARTAKEFIRSAGVGGECVTEVEFEHEGHLYLVRRVLKGVNCAVTVEAHADGALMSTGIRDAQRYIESVLGMDDAAFRASVFTEQKQLSAFSEQTPAERRRLVLQLLGITPLDVARDAARKDARELAASFSHARDVLPDVEALMVEADDALARAEAADQAAAHELRALEAATAEAAALLQKFEELDQRRQEHDSLVVLGRAARQEMDALQEAVEEQRRELSDLDSLTDLLAVAVESATGLEQAEEDLRVLAAAEAAAAKAAAIAVPAQPAQPDEEALTAAQAEAAAAREELAGSEALMRAAQAEADRARQAVAKSETLSGEGDCPLCGQALGDAFEKVQAHRARELSEASKRAAETSRRAAEHKRAARAAASALVEIEKQTLAARQAHQSWEAAHHRRLEAERAWLAAWEPAAERWVSSLPEDRDGGPPGPHELSELVTRARADLEGKRRAAAEVARIRGKLERRPDLERSLVTAAERLEAASARVDALREKVRDLGYRSEELDQAAAGREQAERAVRAAQKAATDAAVHAAGSRERAAGVSARLDEGRRQHARLGEMEVRSRHLSRAADLLADFRNTVVASVGPRLAVQAAELFGELTDHEYEQLQVDPDNYEVQIGDGGRFYGLDRFSGSEVDLANLAMRVAISEHIHFQSGGSVGLLVLDEVFGPLDDDRKARMLLALERLRGRFRQVLVVTHDQDIKEQLPNAVEVTKLPGRRAAARIVGD